ncbi:c-type cytochrome [Acidobacteriota bacterium]
MKRALGLLLVLTALALCCESNRLPAEYENMTIPEARLRSIQSQTHGRALFLQHCANCHGENADGHGARNALTGDPTAFADPDWGESVSPRWVFWVILEGKKHTIMAGWRGFIDEDDIWDLVAYLLSVSENSENDNR